LAEGGHLPDDLAVVPVDAIEPCPLQPRVNTPLTFVNKLANSMRAGRHDPVIDVEPIPGQPSRYQILCGEQRWRAAKAAGIPQLVVRTHRRLGYMERLAKQYEENHLRAALDPIEDAACILGFKVLQDIENAERILREALVPFQPLDDKRIERREQFQEHLAELRSLLRWHRIEAETLSTWAETEKALGISESQRKAKIGLLRLDPELLEAVRELPTDHAVQISRLPDRARQEELIARAPELTQRQVRVVVERLRMEPDLSVDEALGSLPPSEKAGFDDRLKVLGDLCRQLMRLLLILRDDAERRRKATPALADLRRALDELLEAA
jgi:ParB/RepB/Spo0J family partition protein